MAPQNVSSRVVTLDVNVIARMLPALSGGYANVTIPDLDHVVRSTNSRWRQGGNAYTDVFSALVHEVAGARGELCLVLHRHELAEAVALWTRQNPAATDDLPLLTREQAEAVVALLTELAECTGGGVFDVDTSRANLSRLAEATGCTDWADDLKVIAGLDGVDELVTADADLIVYIDRGRAQQVLAARAVRPWAFAA